MPAVAQAWGSFLTSFIAAGVLGISAVLAHIGLVRARVLSVTLTPWGVCARHALSVA